MVKVMMENVNSWFSAIFRNFIKWDFYTDCVYSFSWACVPIRKS
jgi:hypothetical protein